MSIRTTATVKGLIQKTAETEGRFLASMIEVMALDHAARRGVSIPGGKVASKGKKQ
jgi:hypothetical protein